MKSQLQIQLALLLGLFLLVACTSLVQAAGRSPGVGGDVPSKNVKQAPVASKFRKCTLSDLVWKMETVDKYSVNIKVTNTCRYCKATKVAIYITLIETLIDAADRVVIDSIPAGKYKVYKYQQASDVISQIHIASVDFVHCHP